MKKLIPLLFVVALVGCKGPQGEKGDVGSRGSTGANAQMSVYTGIVFSDNQSISAPAYLSSSVLVVYVTNGSGAYLQLPIYNVAGGYNVAYVAQTGSVTLANALTGGFTNYRIVVANQVSSASASESQYRRLLD